MKRRSELKDITRKRRERAEGKDIIETREERKQPVEEGKAWWIIAISALDYFLSDLYSRRWRKNNFLKKSPDDTKKEDNERNNN